MWLTTVQCRVWVGMGGAEDEVEIVDIPRLVQVSGRAVSLPPIPGRQQRRTRARLERLWQLLNYPPARPGQLRQ